MTFATVVTLAMLLIYVAMIAHDVTAMRKVTQTQTETIDTSDMQEQPAPTSVEDSDRGILFHRAAPQALPPQQEPAEAEEPQPAAAETVQPEEAKPEPAPQPAPEPEPQPQPEAKPAPEQEPEEDIQEEAEAADTEEAGEDEDLKPISFAQSLEPKQEEPPTKPRDESYYFDTTRTAAQNQYQVSRVYDSIPSSVRQHIAEVTSCLEAAPVRSDTEYDPWELENVLQQEKDNPHSTIEQTYEINNL